MSVSGEDESVTNPKLPLCRWCGSTLVTNNAVICKECNHHQSWFGVITATGAPAIIGMILTVVATGFAFYQASEAAKERQAASDAVKKAQTAQEDAGKAAGEAKNALDLGNKAANRADDAFRAAVAAAKQAEQALLESKGAAKAAEVAVNQSKKNLGSSVVNQVEVKVESIKKYIADYDNKPECRVTPNLNDCKKIEEKISEKLGKIQSDEISYSDSISLDNSEKIRKMICEIRSEISDANLFSVLMENSFNRDPGNLDSWDFIIDRCT